MKKYKFRLAQVQRVRQIEEDRARAAVLTAQAEVRRVEVERDRRMREYAANSMTVGLATRAAHLAERTMLELRADRIVRTEEDLVHASERAAERLAEWAAAAQRVQALERLDERRREEYAIELQREEDRVIDDLVTGRFGRGDHGPGEHS